MYQWSVITLETVPYFYVYMLTVWWCLVCFSTYVLYASSSNPQNHDFM